MNRAEVFKWPGIIADWCWACTCGVVVGSHDDLTWRESFDQAFQHATKHKEDHADD